MNSAETKEVVFGGEPIKFTLQRTARRKTISVAVGLDGVRVLAPMTTSGTRIEKTVKDKGAWILKKLSSYSDLGLAPPPREFVSGEAFHYLGRPYRLRIESKIGVVLTRIKRRGGLLIAPLAPNTDPTIRRATLRSALSHWLKDHATRIFPERAKILAEKLGTHLPPIKVVEQSKRWGSCDKRGHIRLNWRLVMLPMTCIDYVIAHELCHILVPDHSRRFWTQLEILMPDCRERIHKLNQKAHQFYWS
jgi:predicted metal-dependent hydrolase